MVVHHPGAMSLIQDQGRHGFEHMGVPSSGAADLALLALANTLVGNSIHAAAIEFAFTGPTATFTQSAVIAVVGPHGQPVPMWVEGKRVASGHSVHVGAGQRVTIGALASGVRGYCAIAGGVANPLVLGSRSACTLSGLGGGVIAAGSRIPIGLAENASAVRAIHRLPTAASAGVCRIILNAHQNTFTHENVCDFLKTEWITSSSSSRVGIRLEGKPLNVAANHLPSLGMVRGAIQIPPDGQPIILGPDHGVTGGYPVIGVIVSADFAVATQALPGQTIRFSTISGAATVPINSPHVVNLTSLLA